MKKNFSLFGVPVLFIISAITMGNISSKVWFQGSQTISSTVDEVNKSLGDLGEHYTKVIRKYPGITTVELVDQGKDFVTIQTNEGTMKRTNISIERAESSIKIELDEEYVTSKLTTTSQIVEKFENKDEIMELQIRISNLSAPGFLGFFLRNFGSKNIGNGFLQAYKQILEQE